MCSRSAAASWAVLSAVLNASRSETFLAAEGQGTGLVVQGLRFRVQGAGFRVQGSGFMVHGLGFRV